MESFIKFKTKEEWVHSAKSNALLFKLKQLVKEDKLKITSNYEIITPSLNSIRSLPMTKFPKDEIFCEVMIDKDIKFWKKPMIKWFRLGKFLLKNYKEGIINTYKVFRESQKLENAYKGKVVNNIFKIIEFKEIEKRKKGVPVDLSITRKEFQEWKRRGEFWKIPYFSLLLIIFEEFIVLICYLFPGVAPRNCLIPGTFDKLIKRSYITKLLPKEHYEYKSPYKLNLSEQIRIIKENNLISSPKLKIYQWSKHNKIICEKITEFSQYLFIDDWLLLDSFLNKPVNILSDRELVNCIVERRLYTPDENLNHIVQTKQGQELFLWRLIIYLSWKFNGTITVNDKGNTLLFSEKWGINNINILNAPGGSKLVLTNDLACFQD